MRYLLACLVLVTPLSALGQDTGGDEAVRSAEEIPEDMPAPPESAPPADAPAVGAAEDRPPHPETPEPLDEAQPNAETLAKTMYHWLPGHWALDRRAIRVEKRRVDLRGQRHDLGAPELAVGREAMGLP